MTGMLALNGLFILVTRHGLEYPAFYRRLYGLLSPDAFQVGMGWQGKSTMAGHGTLLRLMRLRPACTQEVLCQPGLSCVIADQEGPRHPSLPHACAPQPAGSRTGEKAVQLHHIGLVAKSQHAHSNACRSRFLPPQAKQRVRFFQLADVFLASGMVPAYTAAAFAKRFGRLALRAPPAGVHLIAPCQ